MLFAGMSLHSKGEGQIAKPKHQGDETSERGHFVVFENVYSTLLGSFALLIPKGMDDGWQAQRKQLRRQQRKTQQS